MKTIIAFLLVFLMTMPLFASELTPGRSGLEPEGTSLRKLQRGVLNIAASPLEIMNDLAAAKSSETLVPSYLTGFITGGVKTVRRALTGVFEIVTFWLPYPNNYAPVVQPEFAWERLEV